MKGKISPAEVADRPAKRGRFSDQVPLTMAAVPQLLAPMDERQQAFLDEQARNVGTILQLQSDVDLAVVQAPIPIFLKYGVTNVKIMKVNLLN